MLASNGITGGVISGVINEVITGERAVVGARGCIMILRARMKRDEKER